MDRQRDEKALRRLHRHQHPHRAEAKGAGVGGERRDLAGAEGEAGVPPVTPGKNIGSQSDAQRQDMGAHVPAVGQQGHRVEPPAHDDLDDHHAGGEERHPASRPFGFFALGGIAAEHMAVAPALQIVGMHRPGLPESIALFQQGAELV